MDGKGLQPVPDANLAQALLDKVNAANIDIGVKAMIPVAIFAALPQSSSTALVAMAWIFAALYLARNKIPLPP